MSFITFMPTAFIIIHSTVSNISIMSNHVSLVQLIHHPSCPQNLTCSPASGRLCTLHGKASYPPLSPLTKIWITKTVLVAYRGKYAPWNIQYMIYINTDYDRKLIKTPVPWDRRCGHTLGIWARSPTALWEPGCPLQD